MPTKLKDLQRMLIRRRHADGASQCQLAKEFNVSQAAIFAIVHGATGKDLPDAPHGPYDDIHAVARRVELTDKMRQRELLAAQRLLRRLKKELSK